MALRLWTGPSGSGKTRFLFEYVLKEAQKNKDINYIVIVPEQFTLSTQREFIRLSKDHGIINVDVLSFARLALKIFEEVGFKEARGTAIDDMGKNLILRHIATKCEDQLTVFNGKMDKLGYITEVKSAISEFMQYGIGADKLTEMISTAKEAGRGQLAAKLSDMEVLYREFNNYIDQKYITREEYITKASRAVVNSKKIRKSVIVFDGFTGFTPVQYNLIEVLMQISRDIHVTILTDTRDNITYNTKHELFYLGYKTAKKLKEIAKLNNIDIVNDFEIKDSVPRRFLMPGGDDKGKKVTSKMLVHLEKNLFREYSEAYKEENSRSDEMKLPTKAVNSEIRVFSALQPIDEVRKVAVEIQKLIRESAKKSSDETKTGMESDSNLINNTRVRYKNIAIATGDLETYAPAFRRVFAEYGIPYFIDKTFPVLMNPFIEFIRALLDVITENFSYSAMFRYLRSPLNDYDTADIDNLENFVLKHGVAGLSVWNSDWQEKYERYYKKNKDSDEEESDEQLISIENIRKNIMSDMTEIVDLITDGEKKRDKKPTKTVNEINTVFISVLEHKCIEDHIKCLYDKYSKTDEIFKREKEKEYEKIYNLVLGLYDRMSELLGEEKITLSEYGELLDAGFDEIRVGVIPTITDYIQIGDITRSRFDDVHTLFIVGANDGVIPKSSSTGGIISDIEKEFLIGCTPDIELSPTIREQSFTGQLYLYMLMTKPAYGLNVSYSRITDNGDSMRPSYVIKVLTDMFPGISIEKDFDDVKDTIYSIPSLYDAIVENIRDNDVKQLISTLLENEECGELFKDNLLNAVDSAFFTGVLTGRDSISKAVASIIYGSTIIGSVTKLEQYARCSLSYFLKYGLSLKEREVFSFEARDMGTLLHSVMEKYAVRIMDKKLNWTEIDDEQMEELVGESIAECMDDPYFSILASTSRHRYMTERIHRISMRSIKMLTEHLAAGDFVPKGTEISFSSASNLDSLTFKLSESEIMKFTGKIDRLDTYSDDEHLYIKIIDYKSGDKSLDLVEVYRGLSLQLVVYLNAATEILSRNIENIDKDIVPAGILYYHIDDPLVEGQLDEDEDSVALKIRKELKMRGLVNSDETVLELMDHELEGTSEIIPVSKNNDGGLSKNSAAVSTEKFNIISEYVNDKIRSLGREILDGNIKAEPHSAKAVDRNKCNFCPYVDICKFNGEETEYTDGISKDNVLEEMERIVLEGRGN